MLCEQLLYERSVLSTEDIKILEFSHRKQTYKQIIMIKLSVTVEVLFFS